MEPAATDKRIALAAVAGAHGIKGEVRLKLFSDSVESLALHSTVFIGDVEHKLVSVRDGKVPVARIEGIGDRNSAEALRGSLIEVDREALPALAEGEYYYADIIGLTCFTAAGEVVGSVLAVENFGAGDILDIELATGGRAMVPFRDGVADLVDARIVLDPNFIV